MRRWHEQRGGKAGLRNKVIHAEHPLAKDTMLCGRDAFEGSMAETEWGAINCPSCQAVVLACKAVPKRMLKGAYDLPPGKIALVKARGKVA